jgi:hypothetical protein
MDYQLFKQCQQTVYISTADTIDTQTGEPISGFASSYAARVMERTQKVMNRDGQEVVSHSQIILASSLPIDCDFLVWVPGEDKDNDPGHAPLAVKNAVDEKGAFDYCKVFLGGAVRG